MTERVAVPPAMLRWACERAGHDVAYFAKRIPQLPAWLSEERQPTFRQLEKLAKATHTPFGYLFLPAPPDETLTIPDFRTLTGGVPNRPSPDLLDTLHAMQRRQDWLHESLAEAGADPLPFAGSARLADDPSAVGREMRQELGPVAPRASASTGCRHDLPRQLRTSARERDRRPPRTPQGSRLGPQRPMPLATASRRQGMLKQGVQSAAAMRRGGLQPALQPVAQRHQLVRLRDDAVLLGERRER